MSKSIDNPWRSILRVSVISLVVVTGIAFLGVMVGVGGQRLKRVAEPQWGATFSLAYADSLGLAWREVLTALTEDLGIRVYRVPVYWDRVEKEHGKFDWNELDELMDYADERHLAITLVVGQRVPRWPECHWPVWAGQLSDTERREAIARLIKQVVTRYNDRTSLVRWQVENEPFLNFFGRCPIMRSEDLRQEISLVRQLSSLPIMVTDSGELSSWLETAPYSDYLGVSVYRLTANRIYGNLKYPWSADFYRQKAKLLGQRLSAGVIISELQMEPWGVSGLADLSVQDQISAFDLNQARQQLAFAREIGFAEVYVWGVEWWYWLKQRYGRPEFWELGREIF